MIRRTMMAVTFWAGSMGSGLAGEIGDLAREAEAKASAGQYVEAVEALRRALDSLMAGGPLTLRRVQFIAQPPKGFGLYQPRANNVFRRREPLIVYAEPIGMGWRTEGDVHHAHLVTDFEVRASGGQVLGGQKEFGSFEFDSRDRNLEIMTQLTIRLPGAPRGNYVFQATYRDQVNGKSATLELPFEIR